MNSAIPRDVVCRACVTSCNTFKSLYKFSFKLSGKETNVAELMTFCTNLEFSENERPTLPEFICLNCLRDLTKAYLFKKKVLDADELLRFEIQDEGGNINKGGGKAPEIKTEIKQEVVNVPDDHIKTEQDSCDNNDQYTEPLQHVDEVQKEEETIQQESINAVKEEEIYNEYIISDDEDIKEEEQYHVEIITMEMEDNTLENSVMVQEEGESEVAKSNDTKNIDQECNTLEIATEFVTDEHADNGSSNTSFENPIEVTPNSNLENCVADLLVKPKQVKFISECKICGEQFNYKTSFVTHMRKAHTEDTPHQCDICDESFKTRYDLAGHKSTHIPNKCKICGKTYRQPFSLKTHMKSHNGEQETFTCKLCGKVFNRKWSYQQHMFTHTDNKGYSCDLCEKKFTSPRYLIYHYRNSHHRRQKNSNVSVL